MVNEAWPISGTNSGNHGAGLRQLSLSQGCNLPTPVRPYWQGAMRSIPVDPCRQLAAGRSLQSLTLRSYFQICPALVPGSASVCPFSHRAHLFRLVDPLRLLCKEMRVAEIPVGRRGRGHLTSRFKDVICPISCSIQGASPVTSVVYPCSYCTVYEESLQTRSTL